MNSKAYLSALVLITLPALTAATEGPTLELGRVLFESTELGAVQRSCKSCHLQGKGLQQAAVADDDVIKEHINRCIRNAQQGEVLASDSQEMEALLNYVRDITPEHD